MFITAAESVNCTLDFNSEKYEEEELIVVGFEKSLQAR